MGLDMYLYLEHYVGGNYEHRNVSGEDINITINTETDNEELLHVPLNKVVTIEESVAYWRKANHIHNWFMNNTDVTIEDVESEATLGNLKELLEVCRQVVDYWNQKEKIEIVKKDFLDREYKIETVNDTSLFEELLPTIGGFFFGSIDYDQGYIDDVEYTIGVIKNELLKDRDEYATYRYYASW